ncbi:MAG TPA: glycosyltransferase family 2 protein [Trebonia sp.]|nr:glycosyltransferase family 2 protein [Trebonia sp.]
MKRAYLRPVLGGLAAVMVIAGGLAVIPVTLFVVGLYNLAISSMEACWRSYAERHPDAYAELSWPERVAPGAERLSFTLIVCALDEAPVIASTLAKLLLQSHRFCQVIVSLRDFDAATIEAVRAFGDEHPGRIETVIGHYPEKGKHAQLNGALPYATGDYVCPIDAEGDVAPELLVHVESLIHQTGADIVQGAVQLMNLGSRPREWFQPHNVLEYYAWFSSRMLFQVDAGFVPLGGNTVFLRTELARAAGGWPNSVTEDCAMGVLLCAEFGAKAVAAFDPALATREEVPPTIFSKPRGSLYFQRVRWLEGIYAELVRGRWLQMPTARQRLLAGYILAAPLMQAVSCAMLPLALASSVALKVPEGLVLFLYTPLIPLALTMLSMLSGLRQFGRDYGQRVRLWHYASILFLTPVYQVILAAAALGAVYRHYWGNGEWYRTGRGMQHRPGGPPAGPAGGSRRLAGTGASR